MGKTAQGAVWLNPERLPDFDYWQYWRNVDDADVGRFLRLFTDLPVSEIKRLEKLEGAESSTKPRDWPRGDRSLAAGPRRPPGRSKRRGQSGHRVDTTDTLVLRDRATVSVERAPGGGARSSKAG